MLKMSLNEIRVQIQIHPESWTNIYSTNCYAYVLGLDVEQFSICPYAYQPGTLSNEVEPDYFIQEDVREISNGIWSHKNGFRGYLSKRDYIGNIITNSMICCLEPYQYQKCYALKLKER